MSSEHFDNLQNYVARNTDKISTAAGFAAFSSMVPGLLVRGVPKKAVLLGFLCASASNIVLLNLYNLNKVELSEVIDSVKDILSNLYGLTKESAELLVDKLSGQDKKKAEIKQDLPPVEENLTDQKDNIEEVQKATKTPEVPDNTNTNDEFDDIFGDERVKINDTNHNPTNTELGGEVPGFQDADTNPDSGM